MARILKKPWMAEFVQCCLPHTEAPKNYLLWSAISVIGGVLKDKIFIKDGTYTIRPNQFIVLTGPPAIGKGTAITFAWKMVKTKPSYQLANTLSDRVTAERMIELIANGWALPPKVVNGQVIAAQRDKSCTLFAPELQSLVGASEWMLPFLCQAWDQDSYEYDTKNKGTQHIKSGMCVSLIGATIPDYIRNMERDVNASIAGGFSSRCIFVFADKKSKELPFAEPLEKNPKSYAMYQNLLADLEHISSLSGEYTMNTDAELAFRNFYPDTNPLPEDSDAILHFKGRMKAHVYKLALVLTACTHDFPVIRGPEMQAAITIINFIKQQITRVFRGIGSSEIAEPTARIQLAIEKHGMVSRRELLRTNMMHMTSETLDRILIMLKAIGFCKEISQGGTVYYVPITKVSKPITKGIVI